MDSVLLHRSFHHLPAAMRMMDAAMSHRGRDDPTKGARILVMMGGISLPVLIALMIWFYSS